MKRDLDIELVEPIDPNFKENIKGVTSASIIKKLEYPSPLSSFKIVEELTNKQVNIARFMMEGIGFSSKYWLCCGLKTLEHIMEYNIKDSHYNELTDISDRKDVLCLKGLPLFYTSENHLGDCLLLVSDLNAKKVRTICFIVDDLEKKKVVKKTRVKKSKPYKKKLKVINQDGDVGYDEEDWDDDDDCGDIPY